MSRVQVAVRLQETGGGHQVLHHVLAEDLDHAQPWIKLWNGLSSTKAGRTEVVTRELPHPPYEVTT